MSKEMREKELLKSKIDTLTSEKDDVTKTNDSLRESNKNLAEEVQKLQKKTPQSANGGYSGVYEDVQRRSYTLGALEILIPEYLSLSCSKLRRLK